MIEVIKTAIPLGLLLSVMIGPIFFVLLETSITKGFRAALFLDIGVILADVFYIIIAYFGSKQLIADINNQPGLFVLGGTLMLVYGILLFFKKETVKPKKSKVKGTYLLLIIKGFLLNIINIGVLLFG